MVYTRRKRIIRLRPLVQWKRRQSLVARPNALIPAAYAAGKGEAPLAFDLPPKSIVVVTVKP
ncbi:hypothetical protein [Massilia pseudoviolaceinigra]|uniref:hypothetical protein n=1 Tax=Massilia pseudoviolaceinigra TaxID=3057165 RepID=UPI002796A85A|nr:hypothetical protein [Massilia sp. CCM 9206]MDQ1919198.1 hypothetical protein [Massilia sp. CCM 9206]